MENARASRFLHVLPVPCHGTICQSPGFWNRVAESCETSSFGNALRERIFSRGLTFDKFFRVWFDFWLAQTKCQSPAEFNKTSYWCHTWFIFMSYKLILNKLLWYVHVREYFIVWSIWSKVFEKFEIILGCFIIIICTNAMTILFNLGIYCHFFV